VLDRHANRAVLHKVDGLWVRRQGIV